jgi:hypothetical protein
MIGLGGTLGDDMRGSLRQRIAKKELEFAGLVPAGRKTGAIIALDEYIGTAKVLAQPGQGFQWSRGMAESDTLKS